MHQLRHWSQQRKQYEHYCVSRKSWPILQSTLLYTMCQDLSDSKYDIYLKYHYLFSFQANSINKVDNNTPLPIENIGSYKYSSNWSLKKIMSSMFLSPIFFPFFQRQPNAFEPKLLTKNDWNANYIKHF